MFSVFFFEPDVCLLLGFFLFFVVVVCLFVLGAVLHYISILIFGGVLCVWLGEGRGLLFFVCFLVSLFCFCCCCCCCLFCLFVCLFVYGRGLLLVVVGRLVFCLYIVVAVVVVGFFCSLSRSNDKKLQTFITLLCLVSPWYNRTA